MPGRLLSKAALLLAVVTGSVTAAENEARKPDQLTNPAAESLDDAAERLRPTESSKTEQTLSRKARTRIVFITAKDCDQCQRELTRLRRPGGDFEAMKARGWKIGESEDSHLQIVDRDSIPELVSKLDVREFPTVACVSNDEIVRSFKHGCTTPLDSWTFGWLLKGQDERPQAPIPEPIQVTSTGQYPLRGNHWSVDGDWNPSQDKLVSHLRGAVHANQIAATWKIETWSYEELRSLHDNLHEREMGGVTAATAAASQPVSRGFSSSSATNKFFGR